MTHQSSSFSMPLLAWLILGSWLFVGCSESTVRSVDQPLFAVETWLGTWVGEQPEHAMRNANGEPILIRGKAATVKGSTYTFTINADGTAHLHQAFADGRTMTFAGKWRGQLDENQPSIPSNPSDKPRLRAVVLNSLPQIQVHTGNTFWLSTPQRGRSIALELQASPPLAFNSSNEGRHSRHKDFSVVPHAKVRARLAR